MKEHKQLKEICDEIGYESSIYKYVLPALEIHRPEELSGFNIRRENNK